MAAAISAVALIVVIIVTVVIGLKRKRHKQAGRALSVEVPQELNTVPLGGMPNKDGEDMYAVPGQARVVGAGLPHEYAYITPRNVGGQDVQLPEARIAHSKSDALQHLPGGKEGEEGKPRPKSEYNTLDNSIDEPKPSTQHKRPHSYQNAPMGDSSEKFYACLEKPSLAQEVPTDPSDLPTNINLPVEGGNKIGTKVTRRGLSSEKGGDQDPIKSSAESRDSGHTYAVLMKREMEQSGHRETDSSEKSPKKENPKGTEGEKQAGVPRVVLSMPKKKQGGTAKKPRNSAKLEMTKGEPENL